MKSLLLIFVETNRLLPLSCCTLALCIQVTEAIPHKDEKNGQFRSPITSKTSVDSLERSQKD